MDKVYWIEASLSAIVAIKKVLELPPRESRSTKVSLEFLNGTWLDLSPLKQLITIPRVVNDLLILLASFNLSPIAAVLFCLSEPAKSTKWILDFFNMLLPF